MHRIIIPVLTGLCAVASSLAVAQDKPNIVVIWGDDIGESNISAW